MCMKCYIIFNKFIWAFRHAQVLYFNNSEFDTQYCLPRACGNTYYIMIA